MRVFLAIPIPDEIKKNICDIPKELEGIEGIKTVRPENMHITLKFLGEISDDSIGEIIGKLKFIERYGEFEAELSGVGFFGNPDYIKVIWVGIGRGSEMIEKAAKDINDALSQMFDKDAQFTSHITIARVKYLNQKEKEKIKKIINQSKVLGRFKVRSIELIESILTTKGPEYRLLNRFTFSSTP